MIMIVLCISFAASGESTAGFFLNEKNKTKHTTKTYNWIEKCLQIFRRLLIWELYLPYNCTKLFSRRKTLMLYLSISGQMDGAFKSIYCKGILSLHHKWVCFVFLREANKYYAIWKVLRTWWNLRPKVFISN